jgi:hypothetical protein
MVSFLLASVSAFGEDIQNTQGHDNEINKEAGWAAG